MIFESPSEQCFCSSFGVENPAPAQPTASPARSVTGRAADGPGAGGGVHQTAAGPPSHTAVMVPKPVPAAIRNIIRHAGHGVAQRRNGIAGRNLVEVGAHRIGPPGAFRRQQAHPAAPLRSGQRPGFDPVQKHLPGVRVQIGQGPQQKCLAGSRDARDPQASPAFDTEMKRPQGEKREVFDFQTRHANPRCKCRRQHPFRGGGGHDAAGPGRPPAALMAIISTDSPAGVMPSIREACPREAGRISESFWRSSMERPWIWS